MTTELTSKKCKPCEGGTPACTLDEARKLSAEVPGWEIIEGGKKIARKFEFKNFVEAMKFINKLADLAESEGHHPDIFVSYKRVTITLWTHAIGGLSENDFILAAKANELLPN